MKKLESSLIQTESPSRISIPNTSSKWLPSQKNKRCSSMIFPHPIIEWTDRPYTVMVDNSSLSCSSIVPSWTISGVFEKWCQTVPSIPFTIWFHVSRLAPNGNPNSSKMSSYTQVDLWPLIDLSLIRGNPEIHPRKEMPLLMTRMKSIFC